MIQELFNKAREAVNSFFNGIDVAKTEELLNHLAKCEGALIFTGVGKSGLVAKKIAMTMTSCGTRAMFLSPVDALHGDLGIATNRDILIAFSKSGESDELLALIPALRNKGTEVVSIVCNDQSRLAKASDLVLTIPMQKELCPYNMAPTTSTVTQMIIGDILTIGLMQLKNFSLDDYAGNHPAGSIGRRISLRVKDLMIKDQAIPRCSASDKLVDTLVELSQKKCGCVLVTDINQKLLGIFTDGDLRRALQKLGADALQSPIEQLMTRGAKTTAPEELVYTAMQLMESDQKNAITTLPVIDKDQVVGLIKLHDIIQSGI